MRIKDIRELCELMAEFGIAELEVSEGKRRVRLIMEKRSAVQTPQPASQKLHASLPTQAETPPGEKLVTSPMVGSFYRRPNPESPPFVEAGSAVQEGTTLCTIEAMKLFNPIEADCRGTVKTIHVEDGAPVEYGQPLFTITLDGGTSP